DPLSSEERVNLGYIYELRGRHDLAEKEYAKAIRKDRKNWLAYYNLGNIHAKRGDWDKAQDLYEEALSIRWEPDALNNLAYVLMKKGDYCSALWTIQEALKKHVKEEYTKTKEEIVKAIENSGVRCLSLEREGESR
ncbi:MAG: tetratricopeptide repeat protein, partial [Aquificaceae bacterium]|nr:tetratricopeptide repeat protein [Aquificaceae bacterium]